MSHLDYMLAVHISSFCLVALIALVNLDLTLDCSSFTLSYALINFVTMRVLHSNLLLLLTNVTVKGASKTVGK